MNMIEITAGFEIPEQVKESFTLYLQSIEQLLKKIIPREILSMDPKQAFITLNKELPIIYPMINQTAPCVIPIALLCAANYTHGVGRFLCDKGSRWLVPGKQISLVVVRALNFQFLKNPNENYFFTEIYARIEDVSDLKLIRHNMPNFIREMRLNILAVQHARHIVTVKPLSLNEKMIMIQENFASLIKKPIKELDNTIFDELHHLLIKATAEEKVTQLKNQMTTILENRVNRSKIYDRVTFNEIEHFIYLFKESFTATRSLKHLTRVISYQYLFKKSVQNAIEEFPNKRHLNFKLLKTTVQINEKNKPLLGILVILNRLRENEIFEQRHIIKAIQTYIPHIQYVEDSYIVDRFDNDRVRTLYLEIEKPDGEDFNPKELKMLNEHLSREFKSRIETVIHPIFMYRNEEETMRNILTLSKQLRFVDDIPQVIISFHKQTDLDISFTVILLRLIKPNDLKLKELFQKKPIFFKVHNIDIKIIGLLRKKYPKEANVFEVTLDKKPFLRKDFSLDLYKARQVVINELFRLFGEVRDYNGGMISKQNEVFKELKHLLLKANVRNDFLLENFFYSLTPSYMQSLISPKILKEVFIGLLKITDEPYQDDHIKLNELFLNNYYIAIIGSLDNSFKEHLMQKLESFILSFQECAHSSLSFYDTFAQCVIFRLESPKQCAMVQEKIKLALESLKTKNSANNLKKNTNFFFQFGKVS